MTRPLSFRPALSITQILGWADAFHERFGRWPTRNDKSLGLSDTTWSAVSNCLRVGLRGLNPGSSLAKLLQAKRSRRHKGRLPRLTPRQILRWADDYHARTGKWPGQKSGPVREAPGETWGGVNAALGSGCRGLRGGSSLAQLLAQRRGVRNHLTLPGFTEEQILVWADAHNRRTGQWPCRSDGPIVEAPGETWAAVDSALGKGSRGLPGGSSLAQLLQAKRGVRNVGDLPKLECWEVLVWADAHRERTGFWPTAKSGLIPEAPGETWAAVDSALWEGTRELPGRDSLARLLARRRGAPNPRSRPRLSIQQILRWADGHRGETGNWPGRDSGEIPGAGGETWCAVNRALQRGGRGLKGGSSLAQLLDSARGVRNRATAPALTHAQILKWADAHKARAGRWPSSTSGQVTDAPGETWLAINAALSVGNRGLPGDQSLTRLLAEHRGKRNHLMLPRLSVPHILAWADAHHAHTGRWPAILSGAVSGVADQTWRSVDAALRVGVRGLPGGDSLARLLQRRRKVQNPNIRRR